MGNGEKAPADVVRLAALAPGALEALLEPYGLVVEWTGAAAIPGSYWGESEAGLAGDRLVVRRDTPVHSALHEACHWICAANRGKRGAIAFDDAGARDAAAFENEADADVKGMRLRPAFSPAFSIDTDAGGDDLEECAVCYLQCLLADAVPGYSRARMFADMDAWGYSFRLGSARAWFEQDAEDARAWLAERGLVKGGSAR